MVFYLLLAALFTTGASTGAAAWYATAFAVGRLALGGVLTRWRRSVAGRTARSMTSWSSTPVMDGWC